MKHLLLLDEARDLRAQGYSYREIAVKLQITKSTAHLWTQSVVINESGQGRIRQRCKDAHYRALQTQHLSRLEKLAIIKQQEIENLNKVELTQEVSRLICAMMFWCEGAKDSTMIDFINSDPKLIQTFVRLFRNAFKVDESKFRILMHLHEYHDEPRQKAFWSKVTSIPPSQFCKTYIKPHTGKTQRVNYPGCIHVRYYDAHIAKQLLTLACLFMEK